MFGRNRPWREAPRHPSGLAPEPGATPEAVIQVYAARAVSWRGLFAVHSWIVVKPAGAPRYSRFEVLGFGVKRGAQAVRIDRTGPDNYWFGARPDILVEHRGGDCDALIAKIRAAVAGYPYPDRYRAWPGPNSNTFIAHIARQIPELGLALPPHALGKDFLPHGRCFAPAPSGTGFQFSFHGLFGLMLSRVEGIEINLLGLSIGIELKSLALKLPCIGRVGLLRRATRSRAPISRPSDALASPPDIAGG